MVMLGTPARDIVSAGGAENEEGLRPTLVSAPTAAWPELVDRPHRRRTFTAADKVRILAEIDSAGPGGCGAILRREGLCSSAMTDWRRPQVPGPNGAGPNRRAPRRRMNVRASSTCCVRTSSLAWPRPRSMPPCSTKAPMPSRPAMTAPGAPPSAARKIVDVHAPHGQICGCYVARDRTRHRADEVDPADAQAFSCQRLGLSRRAAEASNRETDEHARSGATRAADPIRSRNESSPGSGAVAGCRNSRPSRRTHCRLSVRYPRQL